MEYNVLNEYVRVYDDIRVGIFLGGFHMDIDYCPWCGRKIFLDRVWEE